MTKAKIENGAAVQFPYTRATFQKDHSGVSLPRDYNSADLTDFGVFDVVQDDRPEPGPGEVVEREDMPSLSGGAWRIGWTARPMTADETAAQNNRRADEVNRERDRRIEAGFAFEGVVYQSGEADRENIAGASVSALGAMTAGAQPGDLRWHGGASDFVWIAADNTEHPMDAQTMFAFGQAAMAHKQAHIFAARSLKDMAEIPADFAADAYWPEG